MSRLLVYTVSMFAAIGGFLFGYDTGVISGVLVTPSFVRAFFPINSLVQGAIVSTLIAGAFVGSLVSGILADRMGRKYTILLASVIFILGAGLQSGAMNLGMLYAGRFVAGFSIGQLSMVVPLYQSEISSPDIRGRLISLQQFAITVGIAASFWVDYLCQGFYDDLAWRLPLGLQAAPAVILAVGTIFLPFSPRWLIDKDRDEEGKRVIADLRAGGDVFHPIVQEEYDEIKREVLLEREIAVGSYLDLFRGSIRRRVILGITIQAFQQLTGINAIMYYAPLIFQMAGLPGINSTLLAQGINGIVNMTATVPAILFVDKWGRRPTLISGALIMGISMILVGSLLGGFKLGVNNVTPNTGASYSTIVFIYTFVAGFAYSWGPIGWIYPSEIFPLSIRSKAISISTASNWLFNYIVGLLVPILIEKIGWVLMIIFGTFGFIMAASIYFFFPETKGRSLEEMDIVFGDVITDRDDPDKF
ncbi:sugar transporter [Neoconidiobolus thromboides FSU 785]|nr:sugar transporter [Neoconidiobolus thromboides FSU 785]